MQTVGGTMGPPSQNQFLPRCLPNPTIDCIDLQRSWGNLDSLVLSAASTNSGLPNLSSSLSQTKHTARSGMKAFDDLRLTAHLLESLPRNFISKSSSSEGVTDSSLITPRKLFFQLK